MVDCLGPSAALLQLESRRRNVAHRALLLASTASAAMPIDGQPPLIEGVRNLLVSVIPEAAPKGLDLVPAIGPHLNYHAEAALDGADLTLSFSLRASRLLRSERSAMRSEVALLQWLAKPGEGLLSPSLASRSGQLKQDGVYCSHCGGHHQTCDGATGTLLPFLPRLIKYGTARDIGQGEYTITRPAPGTSRAALAAPPYAAQEDDLDLQTGRLLRCISSQVSPNGKFGTAFAVLSPQSGGDDSVGHMGERPSTPDRDARYETWSDAFISLLESALRDAEDFKVAIRYEAIRDHVSRFKHFLDAVSVPRLVVVDAGEEHHTLVSALGSKAHAADWQCDMHGPDEPLLTARHPTDSMAETNGEAATGSDTAASQPRVGQRRASVPLMVTGIRGLGNSVFGDPLFASVLSRNDAAKIRFGFMPAMADRLDDAAACTHHSNLLEDAGHAEVRRLLYECHHAVIAIVREYCRRQSDSDDREMPARKRLTQALRRLDSMDDAGVVWCHHSDDDVYPVKRRRSDNHGSGDG
ncbi:hypothetical protein JDV02_003697 [Purpureocillium takamizusanense]|uniref:Uncharacterized protein n=1 Tax=Purpureocillium takamizusanense TaxID=2060973 RepID=A0A9Q8QB37_9HYPO|nr:uncharacterized protein JDV02_003697 [Purpureocillium takamizusanense]UNI17349.1 hypothetical protein JDV02_003697 [Purpureocillium takamizusanense]